MAVAKARITLLQSVDALLPRPEDPVWVRARAVFGAEMSGEMVSSLRGLKHAGAGAATLGEFVRTATVLAERLGPESGIAICVAGTRVLESAGARAAESVADAAMRVVRILTTPAGFKTWLDVMTEMTAKAPESVTLVSGQMERLLGEMDVSGFRTWVFTGLRAAGGDASARLAFFAGVDGKAGAYQVRQTSDVRFIDIERPLQFYLRALFGLDTALRGHLKAKSHARRTSFDDQAIRLPEAYPGIGGDRGTRLFKGAVAHSAAHAVFTRVRFPVRRLRALQVALISLIEDARVETLAMRRFPGLRALWLPFHDARAGADLTAPLLMARLARALIDPKFEDASAWVRKGRSLFHAHADNLEDPEISRTIGGLLGNDLGQMRVQFNPKTYVVEPGYRDDNEGLWYYDQEPSTSEAATVHVGGAAKPANDELVDDREDSPEPQNSEIVPVRPDLYGHAAASGSAPIARYPEWDHVIGRFHPDWTTVIEQRAGHGSSEETKRALERHAPLVRKISSFLRTVRSGRPRRLYRQPEGDRLDLNAVIEARTDMAAGNSPDERVYGKLERQERDMATLILLDTSQSTADIVPGVGYTVLRQARGAVALLAQALDDVRGTFAIDSFCSDGRNRVHYTGVKAFDERFDGQAMSRLAGLCSKLSTRMGAALRHAGSRLDRRTSYRKLLLIVTDGEPSDIDVADRQYLVEDARRAVGELRNRGIDVFCVGLSGAADADLRRIFGRRNAVIVDRIARLPEKLSAIYMRVTR